MNNKLGTSNLKFYYIEKEIIKVKLNLIDEYITFGRGKLDFDYLKSLNNFLFSDMYREEEIGIRDISNEELKIANDCLNKIEEICLENKDVNTILKIIKYLWHLQLFGVGNTRTLFAYLKVLNEAYSLNLDINTNIEIISKPSMFDINNFVNQNRLTKFK